MAGQILDVRPAYSHVGKHPIIESHQFIDAPADPAFMFDPPHRSLDRSHQNHRHDPVLGSIGLARCSYGETVINSRGKAVIVVRPS